MKKFVWLIAPWILGIPPVHATGMEPTTKPGFKTIEADNGMQFQITQVWVQDDKLGKQRTAFVIRDNEESMAFVFTCDGRFTTTTARSSMLHRIPPRSVIAEISRVSCEGDLATLSHR